MFFSGKEKKSGGSKVLTEAEIKKKLYGDYETTSSDIHLHAFDARPSVKPAIKNEDKRDFSSPVTPVRSSSFGAASKPEVLISRPSMSSSETSVRRVPAQPSSAASSRTSADWKKGALHAAQVILGFLTGVLWKAGSYLIQALDFILRILDPRKPQARKLLYSISACILVAALFFGVFRLNAQRKKAMMGELRSERAAVTVLGPSSAVPVAAVPVASVPAIVTEPAQVQKEESQEMILEALENSNQPVESEISAIAVPTGGKYVIQVATYAILEDANRIIQALNQAGFTAFSKKQIRHSTGHSFYPVYLGRFESSASAQQTLTKFRRASVARPFQDSFIRTLE